MKAAVVTRYGSPDVVTVCECQSRRPGARRGLGPRPCGDRQPDGSRRAPTPRHRALVLRAPPAETHDLRHGLRGEVEAVGAGVASLKPGDRVFGMCSSRRNGAHAEFVCVPGERGDRPPCRRGIRFDEAVVCEGAFYANGSLKSIPPQARPEGF